MQGPRHGTGAASQKLLHEQLPGRRRTSKSVLDSIHLYAAVEHAKATPVRPVILHDTRKVFVCQ